MDKTIVKPAGPEPVASFSSGKTKAEPVTTKPSVKPAATKALRAPGTTVPVPTHAPAATRPTRSPYVEIVGARTHNLKNIYTNLPLGKLSVITGPSGSGKSSLAFDTLYAEGQRRFVESMSTYARQFIEKMERPDVDQIRNIQPAIAIEQKNSVKNARSTIGTATEIADYLRLLYAKAGTTICPDCNIEVHADSPQSVTRTLLTNHPGARVYVVAPLARSQDVAGEALSRELLRAGFTRLYTGEGTRPFVELDDPEAATAVNDALNRDTLHVLIDRIAVSESDLDRISSSIATAFQAGHGTAEVYLADGDQRKLTFLQGYRCNGCAREFPYPEPNLFSFNSPIGACAACGGFGRVTGVDWEKVFPNTSLTLNDDPVAPYNTPSYRVNYRHLTALAKAARIPFDVPLHDLTDEQLDALKYGIPDHEGIAEFFRVLENERYKVQSRILVARYRGYTTCPDCKGTRLVAAASNVLWQPATPGSLWPRRHIGAANKLSIRQFLAEWETITLTKAEQQAIGRVHREVLVRLQYLDRVGLGYLTLDRQTRTLSGGESQRINLATALGTSLTQTLYVLDEPTVGLHPRDSRRLLGILRDLRDKGNTLVVVEHDPELILGADHLLDIGPAAGSHGGELMFSGTPDEMLSSGNKGLTAKYLVNQVGRQQDAPESEASKVSKGKSAATKAIQPLPADAARIFIHGARENNLRKLDVEIPLHQWVCITGVSGSGKSTLVHNILYQGFNAHAHRPVENLGKFDGMDGLKQIDDIILVDQSAIGRSIRSNPVTYVKAYDPIRKLIANTREAKRQGLTESHFSFNVAGGRCNDCEGSGVTTYDMHFLAEITLPCETCNGKRFMPHILEITYEGKNVDEILNMTVDDAMVFFAQDKNTTKKLSPLRDVGLGYLTLGQSTATLSGGEAQRLKLAAHLANGTNALAKRTIMIFDEPTTGLHMSDLHVLSGVFHQLVEKGYSLVIIEHNLDIIRQADWVIDLGPEAGDGGGQLVACGTPAAISQVTESHTGRFLKEIL